MKLALDFVAAVALILLAGVGAGLSASGLGSEEAQRLRALLDAPIPDPKEHNRSNSRKSFLSCPTARYRNCHFRFWLPGPINRAKALFRLPITRLRRGYCKRRQFRIFPRLLDLPV